MAYVAQTFLDRSLNKLLSLFVVLEAESSFDFLLKVISEVQILLITIQLCLQKDTSQSHVRYSSFQFLHFDEKLMEAVLALDEEFVIAILILYFLIILALLILQGRRKNIGISSSQALEYNIMLIHTFFVYYYVQVISIRFLNLEGLTLAMEVLWIIIAVINNFLAVLGSRFTLNKLRSPYIGALKFHGLFIESLIYKFVDVIVRFFLAEDTARILRIVIATLYLAKRTVSLNQHDFYSFKAQKIFWAIHGIEIGFFLGGLSQLIGSLSMNWSVSSGLIFAALISKHFCSTHSRKFFEFAKVPVEKLRSEYDFEMKLNNMYYLTEKASRITMGKVTSIEELAFRGLIKDYFESLKAKKVKIEEIDINELSLEAYSKLITDFRMWRSKEICQAYLERHPMNKLARLKSVLWQIQFDNEHKSSTILDLMALANNSGREVKILAKKILQKIYRETYDKILAEERVDINIVIDHIKSSSSLCELIKTATSDYYKFWSVDRFRLSMREVLSKAQEFDKISRRLEALWSTLKLNSSKNLQVETLLYSLYNLLIRGQPSISTRISKEIPNFAATKKQRLSPLEKSLTSSETITIMIKRAADGKETILNITKSIEFFGHPVSDILSKGLKLIMPGIYYVSNPPSIIAYIEKTYGSTLGNRFQMYFKKKNGILHLMDCYLTLIEGDDCLNYVLAMQIEEKIEFGMICSSTGVIEGWTEDLDKELDLGDLNEFEELNVFEAFKVEIMKDNGKGLVLSPLKDYHSYKRKTMSYIRSINSMRSRGKTNSTKLSLNHQPHEYLELILKANPALKYKARKSIDWNNVFFLTFEKDFDDDVEESIPEEKIQRHYHRPNSKKVIDTLVLDLNRETAFSSSNHGAVDPLINKELLAKDHVKNHLAIKTELEDKELEQQINQPKNSISLILVNRGIILFILLAIILSLSFLIFSHQKIQNVSTVAYMSILNNKRHLILWPYIYFDAITTQYIIDGLYEDRMGYDPQGYFVSVHESWTYFAEQTNPLYRDMIETLPYFEEEQHKRFFAPIRIKTLDDPEKIETVDLFKLDRMITEVGLRLSYLQYLNISDQDPQDRNNFFMINNIFDDQYIVEESFYEIITDDVQMKLGYIETFGEAICYILLIFSILLYSYIFNNQFKMIKHRTNLAEAFSKITLNDMESHLFKVSRFMELTENKQEPSSLMYDKLTKEGTKKSLDPKLTKDERFRRMNPSKLNYMLYFLLLFIFIMQALVVGISYLNLVLFQDNQKIIKLHVSNSVQAGLYNNAMITLSMSIYSYIYFDGNVTLKNRPYTEVWNELVTQLATSQRFYLSLLDQLDPDLAERLNQIYTQDLCELITDGTCYDPIRPIAKHGAFALFSFIMQASIRIKNEFDLSDKSFEEKYRIIYTEDFINLEWAGYLYPSETVIFMDILQKQVVRTIDKYKSAVSISVGCFVGGFVIFLVFVWGAIRKGLRDQRNEVYETMRMIPLSVVKYNISVKIFWNKFVLKT